MDEVKMINVAKYLFIDDDEKYYLESFTATWCGPCTRVKPYFLDFVKDNNFALQIEYDIPKDQRPTHVKFVPYFQVVKDNGDIVDGIQTSDQEKLIDFLSELRTHILYSDFQS